MPRLVATPDGRVDRIDRALWITPPFDLAIPIQTTLRRAVYQALLADPGVAAMAGPRTFPGYRPQSAALPAIAFRVASLPRVLDLDGQAGLGRARVRVECWALLVADADALALAVRLCLGRAGAARSLAGLAVTAVLPMGEDDNFEDPQEGTDVRPRLIALDWLVHYREATP